MRVLFKSSNLIGDALYISPAWRAWIKKNQITGSPDIVYMQTLPDHVAPLYQGMLRDIFGNLVIVFERLEGEFDFEHTFDVSEAFTVSDKKKQHLAVSYADLLGVTIDTYKPTYIPDEDEETVKAPEAWDEIDELKGCILISMFSASCESRDKNRKGLPPNKMLPFAKWIPMLKYLREKFPNKPIRFLGAPTDNLIPDDIGIVYPGEYMLGIPLNRLALIMRNASLVVTIDNGMSHLAASQETPTFLMYPRCLSPTYILPIGNPNLAWTQMDPVTVNPKELLHKLEFAVNQLNIKGE